MNGRSQALALPGAALAKVGHWLAGLGFWQFVGFSLLVLAAGGIVDAALFPAPEEHVVVRTPAAPPQAASSPASAAEATAGSGRAQEVRIGWNGIVVTERGNAAQDDDDPRPAGDATHGPSRGLVQLLLAALAVLWVLRFIYRSRASAEARVGQAEAAAEREALERKLVEARLQALQAQIEPHFLFNTLAAVEHLIETDPPRAGEMQRHLIAFLRGAMPQLRGRGSRLGDELELCRSYLAIMKIRMEDRLDYRIDLPAELANAPFPTLMLQSVVENAIKHGLEPKPQGGSLRISARAAAGRLRVIVADSGLGFGHGGTAGTGVGLDNIRQRLQALYGQRAALIIAANAPTGAQVTIEVPIEDSSDGDHRG